MSVVDRMFEPFSTAIGRMTPGAHHDLDPRTHSHPASALAASPAVDSPTPASFPSPTAHVSPSSPLETSRGGLRLVQLHDGLARVTRPSGEVAGYVERVADPAR